MNEFSSWLSIHFRKTINAIENWIKIWKKKKKRKKRSERFSKTIYFQQRVHGHNSLHRNDEQLYERPHFWKTSLSRNADYYVGHVSFVMFSTNPLPPPLSGTGFKGAWKNKVQFVRGSLDPYIEIHRSKFPW